MELTGQQLRVIGSLIEKQVTTPDQYPLTLNSLVNACNQKSNREPVTEFTATEIQDTLDELSALRLVQNAQGSTDKVAKYRQRFCNTEFSELQLKSAELALICLLMLRGPQTPGELRTRSNRLYEFSDSQQVEATLERLANNEPPLVAKMPREPGKRESRYVQLFGDTPPPPAISESANASLEQRVVELESQLANCLERIAQLEQQLGE